MASNPATQHGHPISFLQEFALSALWKDGLGKVTFAHDKGYDYLQYTEPQIRKRVTACLKELGGDCPSGAQQVRKKMANGRDGKEKSEVFLFLAGVATSLQFDWLSGSNNDQGLQTLAFFESKTATSIRTAGLLIKEIEDKLEQLGSAPTPSPRGKKSPSVKKKPMGVSPLQPHHANTPL